MTTPKPEDRCANVSQRLGEPLAATASRVRRWLLIEQPGPWGRSALFESGLNPTVAGVVSRAAKAAGARPVLVRHGVASPAGKASSPRSWFAVSSEPGAQGVVRGSFSADADLLGLDVDRVVHEAQGQAHPPLFLVCTNGRHDSCCAEFGRPVYRQLVEDRPDALVLECSHIGGDRFAANVVCLPDGTYYGRVAPGTASSLVTDHLGGRLDLDCYRGRSIHTPVEQAAEIALRRRLGLVALDAVAVVSCGRTIDDADGDRPRWEVTLEVRSGSGDAEGADDATTWRAEVERSAQDAARNLTCHGRPERPPVFWVRSLEPGS